MSQGSAAATRVFRFEVASKRDGRWAIECARERQDDAIAMARALLATKAYEAVRVVRERDVHGRTLIETPIFEALRTDDDEPQIRLSAPDESDCWCTELDDLYGARSRRVIGQMLRAFLDQLGITPTELLHNARFARKLDDAGMLLSSAVHRISRARAEATGESMADSIKFLEKLIGTALRRVVEARANRKHPVPGADGLDPLVERARAASPDLGAQRFFVRHAVALAFETQPSLLARLVCALDWGAGAKLPESVAIVDELIADCLGSAVVLKEMLGAQPELGAALRMSIDLARGRPVATPPRAASWYPALAQVLAEHPCPETRSVLLVRVQRELGTERPLSRGGASEEATALLAIAGGLRDDAVGGYVGGAPMVEAMIRRWQRLDQPGGFSDIEVPDGMPLDRFGDLIRQEPDLYGETKKRALATLLLDSLRNVPVDERCHLFGHVDAIKASGLLDTARSAVLRELAAGG
jgi:hypothetical protein